MKIKPGDIVKSASGGYGPVEKITEIKGVLYYWIDFRYGYRLEKKGDQPQDVGHRSNTNAAWHWSTTPIQH